MLNTDFWPKRPPVLSLNWECQSILIPRAKIHVLGRDEIGGCLTVLCINRLREINLKALADTVEAVQRGLGKDCDVAIAIPISRLKRQGISSGIIKRMLLVDHECRVWSHLCDDARRGENRPSEDGEGIYVVSWRAQQFVEYIV